MPSSERDNLSTASNFSSAEVFSSGPKNIPSFLSPDAIERLSNMRQQAVVAKEAFPSEGGDTIRPKVVRRKKGSKEPFYMIALDDLQEQGVNPEELEELFSTRRGTWILQEQDSRSIYDHGLADDLNSYLRGLFAPINGAIDRSLDGLSPDGFNRHGGDHVRRVVSQGLKLLDYGAASEDERKNLVIAGQAHDIGNIFDRDSHPHISSLMLQRIIPTVKDDRKNWQTINRAIVLHDSDNLRAVTSSWGKMETSDRLRRLADYMKPEGLALLIADKVEVGRDRISNKILASNIIQDPHAVANLLGRNDGVEISGDSFVWHIKYNPEFTPSEMEKFKHFAPGWKRRSEEGEVQIGFFEWEKIFWGLYTERAITTVEAALALFPNLSNVQISMIDSTDNKGEQLRTFGRDNLDTEINMLRNQQLELKKEGVLKRR